MKVKISSLLLTTALCVVIAEHYQFFVIAFASDGESDTSATATANETRQNQASLAALNLSGNSTGSNFVAYNCGTKQVSFGGLSYNDNGSQYIDGCFPSVGYTCNLPFSLSQCKGVVSSTDNLIKIGDSARSHFEASAVALFQGINTFPTLAYTKGTAFLIGNGLALTAAHCVYEMNTFMDDPTLFFINNGQNNFAYSYKISSIYIPKEFYLDGNSNYRSVSGSRIFTLSDQAQQYDWAILKLQTTNLQHVFGSWKIGSKYTLGDVYNLTAGYPNSGYDNSVRLYAATGQYCNFWSDHRYELFQYNVSGMSGGPILGYYHNNYTLDDYTLCVGLISTKITYPDGAVSTGGVVFTNELISLANYVS